MAPGSASIWECLASYVSKPPIFPPGSMIIWRYFKKGARCFSLTRECSDGSAFTLGRRCRIGGRSCLRRSPRASSRQRRLAQILQRRRRTPLKALLLMQEFFPGIGNWMADEILWQAYLHPRLPAGSLDDSGVREFFRVMRSVCRIALKTIGRNWSNPPADWLIHQRWNKDGHCPRHGIRLKHAIVGGRNTAWCPRCQELKKQALRTSECPDSA